MPRGEPRLKCQHLAVPVLDEVRRIKSAEADDVLETLQDVVGHVGDRMHVGIDCDAAHEPRNPLGSRVMLCALVASVCSAMSSSGPRAVMRALCIFKALCTQVRSS